MTFVVSSALALASVCLMFSVSWTVIRCGDLSALLIEIGVPRDGGPYEIRRRDLALQELPRRGRFSVPQQYLVSSVACSWSSSGQGCAAASACRDIRSQAQDALAGQCVGTEGTDLRDSP